MKITMKRLFNIIAFALVFFTVNAYAANAPNFHLRDAKGHKVSLKQFRGKLVYLDFWASWCRPCQKSFPWMAKIQNRYHKKGLEVIAINLDLEKDDAIDFLAANRANFTVVFDSSGKTAEAYKVSAMPTSFLIDKNGHILSTHYGFREKDAHKKEAEIKKHLN